MSLDFCTSVQVKIIRNKKTMNIEAIKLLPKPKKEDGTDDRRPRVVLKEVKKHSINVKKNMDFKLKRHSKLESLFSFYSITSSKKGVT